MNRLSISESEFNAFYPDLLGRYAFFNENPTFSNKADFEKRYLCNKLWRLNNIYKVVNKDGRIVKFKMNRSQHIVYSKSRKHPRIIILKSRQQGISTFWLYSFMDDSLFCPNLSIGLMAQGQDEASTLLERSKLLFELLDPSIKNFIGVKLNKDNKREIALSNNSTLYIRVSFRSTTLQRLHISEMGKIANDNPKRATEVKTGTLQALHKGNIGVIESTAEGHNIFKEIWDSAVLVEKQDRVTEKDFLPVFLSWLDDSDCVIEQDQVIDEQCEEYFNLLEESENITLTRQQKNFWITQKRELGDSIYQEYPATPEEAFRASRDGTYYAKAFREFVVNSNKIVSNLKNLSLPIDLYFDLGVDDYFVMIATQWHKNEWRIIDEFYGQNKSLQYYLRYIKDLPYKVRCLRFPHDISVRDLSSENKKGLAISRYDIAVEFARTHKLKWHIEALPKDSVANGIEAVRRIIPNMKIDESCDYIISCFENYSKQFDEKLQVWKETPLKNRYAHGADCVRQLAVNTVELERYHQSIHTQKKQRNQSSFSL